MRKITFQDKANQSAVVDATKQVTAEDLNEIKSVVNENADEVNSSLGDLQSKQFDTIALILKQQDSNLIFQGFAKPADSTPAATLNHAYYVIESGTVFGVAATEGEVLVGSGSEFDVRTITGKADQTELDQLAGEVSVKMTNAVVNGDFSNGLSNWTSLVGTTIDNGRMRVEALNSAPFPTYNVGSNPGDACYISFTGHVESGEVARFYNSNISAITIQSQTPTRYSTRYSAEGGVIRFGILNVATFVLYIDNVVLINLTETFGVGNEPTKEEFELLLATLGIDYFEGEITIPAQKLMQWQQHLINAKASHGYAAEETPKTLKQVDDFVSDKLEQLNPTGVTHIKEVTMNKGFLINRMNLEKQAFEDYGYSDPLFLPKGTKIKVSTQGVDLSVITESNVDGDLIKVIEYTRGSNVTEIKNISHTVSDDGYYIICYKVDAEGADLDIIFIDDVIKKEIEHIIDMYDISNETIDLIKGAFVVNKIIDGEVDFRFFDSELYGYSEPIYFKKGINIAFKTAGSFVSLVTKSNQNGDLIEPMITTPGGASLLDLVDYNYTIPEGGYYIISHKAFIEGSYVKLSNNSGTSIDRDEVNEIVGDYIAENAIAVNSIIQTSTSTDSGGNNTIDITLEDGSIHHINIKNGEKGEKGDTVIIGGEESYTLYNELGQNTDGAVTQKALTNTLDKGYYCGLYIYPFRAIANKNVFIYKDALATGLKPLYNYEVYPRQGGICRNFSEKTIRLNSGAGVKEAEFFVKDRYDKIVASKKIEIKLREMPTSKLSSSAEPIDVLFLADSIIGNNINKIGVEFRRMLSTKNDTPIQSGDSILIPTNNLCNGKINLVGEMQDPSNSDNKYQYVLELNQFLKGKRTIPFGSPSAQNAGTWMSQNPFYNPDSLEDDVIGSDGFQKKVDFKWYFENICGEGKYPRLIYLSIGANDYGTSDGWSGDIIPQITSQIIGVCKKMKAASNEIAGGVSNLVIKIFNHQTYPLTSSVINDLPVARARLIQNQVYDSYYNAINDDVNGVKDYVDFVDCASKFDWRNSYDKSLISTNVRSTAKDDLYVHETIHMNSIGAYNYADCLVDDFIVDERFD